MKYVVSNIRLDNGSWFANVEYWKGCRCSSKKKLVEVVKDTVPNKEDFISSLNL